MKALVRTNFATFEITAETQKDLFKQISQVYEVFGENSCGLCGSEEIVPVWRTVPQGKKIYEYPEYKCAKCNAKLSMGCMMEGGGLFPKRKLDPNGKPDLEHGTYGEHRGWTKYRGENN